MGRSIRMERCLRRLLLVSRERINGREVSLTGDGANGLEVEGRAVLQGEGNRARGSGPADGERLSSSDSVVSVGKVDSVDTDQGRGGEKEGCELHFARFRGCPKVMECGVFDLENASYQSPDSQAILNEDRDLTRATLSAGTGTYMKNAGDVQRV